MKSNILLSPAKLNLFFRVLHKRGDGFHEIASLYSKVDLFDELTFSVSDKNKFFCNIPELIGDSNLVIQARDLFFQCAGIKEAISISLKKNIPVGAGLGGGSSNAATTLLGLNDLFNNPLSESQLFELATLLGSDVPFFLSKCKHAYCTGRGEVIQEILLPHSYALWVAKPKNLFLSTPKVYQECCPNEVTDMNPEAILKLHTEGNPYFVNDLELAAFRLEPYLGEVKVKLKQLGFDQVTMTGSGSAFFCLGNVSKPFLPFVDFHLISI